MRRAAKIDPNQPLIVGALRKAGASVQPLHTIGRGCPDVLVGFRGVNFVMEIKDMSASRKDKLSRDEEKWVMEWQGQVAIVRTIEEALKVIGV